MLCLICSTASKLVSENSSRRYFQCPECDFIALAPECRLTLDEERDRYKLHNNQVEDPGYRTFLSTLIPFIQKYVPKASLGLDFGCGPSPSLEIVLKEYGYQMRSYDPYFFPELPSCKFDFVTCCEAVEHFHNPLIDFKIMRSRLKESSYLFLKTHLYEEQDLLKWHYSRDATHTSFYSLRNLEIIKQYCNFQKLEVADSRHIILVT